MFLRPPASYRLPGTVRTIRIRITCEEHTDITPLSRHEIPLANVCSLRQHFIKQPNFETNFSTSFKDQFERHASSQNYTAQQKAKAKVDAIHKELISHYLCGSIAAAQLHDYGSVDLTYLQRLSIYQRMCHDAGKTVCETIAGSLDSLKDRPYVNIIDLIDACRSKTVPRTFDDFNEL
jgi:hypothetical protein